MVIAVARHPTSSVPFSPHIQIVQARASYPVSLVSSHFLALVVRRKWRNAWKIVVGGPFLGNSVHGVNVWGHGISIQLYGNRDRLFRRVLCDPNTD